MLVSAAITTSITMFSAIVGLASPDDVLPGDSGSIVLAAAALSWVGLLAAIARDRLRVYVDGLIHRLDSTNERMTELHRRHDMTWARIDQLGKELVDIRQYLGIMTDAVEAYGDTRETIGRLAHFRDEIDAYDRQVTEVAKQRNAHLRSVQ
jgi:hypothetical protein